MVWLLNADISIISGIAFVKIGDQRKLSSYIV